MQLKTVYQSSDGQFLFLEQQLLGECVYLNVYSNDEHVGEVERVIRTVKERV